MTTFFIFTIVFLLIFLGVALFALKHDGDKLEDLTLQLEVTRDRLYTIKEEHKSLIHAHLSAINGHVTKCYISPIYCGYEVCVTKSDGFRDVEVKLTEYRDDDNDYARRCAEELKEKLEETI